LRVNEKLQVINAFNQPIKDLYAAGDVVGGFHGENYLSGCGLSWAFTAGYLTGRAAAKEIWRIKR